MTLPFKVFMDDIDMTSSQTRCFFISFLDFKCYQRSKCYVPKFEQHRTNTLWDKSPYSTWALCCCAILMIIN
jgi:hypothetical protein